MRHTNLLVFAASVGLLIGCGGAPAPAPTMAYGGAPPAAPAVSEAAAAPSASGMAAEATTPGAPPPVGDEAPKPPPAPSSPAPVRAKTAPATTSAASTGSPSAGSEGTRATSAPEQTIIYTGAIAMLVDDGKVPETIDHAVDAAESVGGFLAARRDTSCQVRVPSPRFREALGKLEKLGTVTHRSVSAQDVGEEMHDAEVQLTNLRATRQRLQEILAKAGSMGDTLAVERELERVSMDIDRVEGRLRFLRSRTAFSDITVDVAARPKDHPVVAQPAPPRTVELPVDWLTTIGASRLLNLH